MYENACIGLLTMQPNLPEVFSVHDDESAHPPLDGIKKGRGAFSRDENPSCGGLQSSIGRVQPSYILAFIWAGTLELYQALNLERCARRAFARKTSVDGKSFIL